MKYLSYSILLFIVLLAMLSACNKTIKSNETLVNNIPKTNQDIITVDTNIYKSRWDTLLNLAEIEELQDLAFQNKSTKYIYENGGKLSFCLSTSGDTLYLFQGKSIFLVDVINKKIITSIKTNCTIPDKYLTSNLITGNDNTFALFYFDISNTLPKKEKKVSVEVYYSNLKLKQKFFYHHYAGKDYRLKDDVLGHYRHFIAKKDSFFIFHSLSFTDIVINKKHFLQVNNEYPYFFDLKTGKQYLKTSLDSLKISSHEAYLYNNLLISSNLIYDIKTQCREQRETIAYRKHYNFGIYLDRVLANNILVKRLSK